jgi:hypothetical protein
MDQAYYQRLLANGTSERLAEMLASRVFPGIKTGSQLLRGNHMDDGLSDLPPSVANAIRKAADRNGVSRAGKRWLGTLATDGPYDPRAWISEEHDVHVLAEERDLNVDGLVKISRGEPDAPPPPVPVAADIVEQEIARRLAVDPGQAGRDHRELQEQVTEEMTIHMDRPSPLKPEIQRRLETDLGPIVDRPL